MTKISQLWAMQADSIFRIRVATILAALLFWEAIALSGALYEGILPKPDVVAVALLSQLADAGFYYDLMITMVESVTGFVIGSFFAVAIGVWLAANPFFRRAYEPYLLALAATPKIIFLPILFLLFGLGIESKIAKSATAAFFPVVFSTLGGVSQISAVHLRVGKSFDLSILQRVTMIYIPAILPPLFVGLRLGMATSVIGVLSAEIAYSDAGLGYRLITFADRYEISQMYATVILIFVVVFLINKLFFLLERRHTAYNRAATSLHVE